MNNQNITEAVTKLTILLKSDKDYRYSWQANIAMQFKDECERQGIKSEQLHEVANKAADNFLDLLCRDAKGDAE